MISYALSTSAITTTYLSQASVEALRKSKIKNLEISLHPFVENVEEAVISQTLTRQLLREGTIRPASVHLPFFSSTQIWDPSALDNELRKDVSMRFAKLIRDCSDFMAPLATLHASHEPPIEEHKKRIDQTCRTIEELVPLAEELNFSINVEYLPRTCLGNSVEELQTIVKRFDPKHVGICFDVNHIMDHHRELPDMITELAPRIRSFHISDYDGVDELHWIPGQGINDWSEIMRRIKAIDHDVLLILETVFQLHGDKKRDSDPIFAIRQNENACWYLENCDRIIAEQNDFVVPGN